MNLILLTIAIPLIAGFLIFILPKKFTNITKFLSTISILISFIINIILFINTEKIVNNYFMFDNLSKFILLFIGLFAVFVIIYSLKYIESVTENINMYFSYILFTVSASYGAALANNLILLSVFWGFLGFTLYMLINTNDNATAESSKAFIIIGATDSLMIIGIGILYYITSSLNISSINISLKQGPIFLPTIAFLTFVAAAFAKAGAMPFHTWIPDMSEKAPIPVTAFLPASLDKLLGIYLLARISISVFELNSSMTFILLLFGSITIIAAVFMALVQHDLRKLLSYHAISQVGYMVLGIGTGNPVGIAGGLFHMLNHSIYKSNLFLISGSVKYRTNTMNMDKLGGLAKYMPITFIGAVIASLSISGVPPFNGFVSKWMVYQGLIDMGKAGSKLWILWLVAAMFGSALTLASFMKVIYSVFLGRSEKKWSFGDVNWTMLLPIIFLSILCVGFGVFAFAVPLKLFIIPALGEIGLFGLWNSQMATLLMLVGIALGFLIYLIGNMKNVRESDIFIGGEEIPSNKRVTGTEFYDSIRDISILDKIYKMAEKKYFDLYEMLKKFTFAITNRLRLIHSGKLVAYILWIFFGMAVLFILLNIRG
ncbi:MAG: hypothetical protein FXF47_02350 [Candidatus Mcinerneyibacterium aminivorans]|uniref:NADH:quinone oxidoreductase/Mrp antiporter transmembrane domain-containing protein n=1 Tax=Candidatus Mcinerneyibacterium aminivorans TaxID=2703815 RepID=A0A5D0MJV5_9BACT|nr:MAG: hypothetical protein FXF47_02350 [Candidatus Mcinerneyibacterium aminivorans]